MYYIIRRRFRGLTKYYCGGYMWAKEKNLALTISTMEAAQKIRARLSGINSVAEFTILQTGK